MSSPVLESFCCVLKRNASIDTEVLEGRPVTLSYDFLCLFASVAGIGGCVYQLYPRAPSPSILRQPIKLAGYQRQNYVITWLAIADFMAAFGIFLRSMLWLTGVFSDRRSSRYEYMMSADVKHFICAFNCAWIQYFYICTYLWTLCYAIDVLLYVKGKPSVPALYQMTGWVVSLLICVSGLVPMYYPRLVRCAWDMAHSLPHYFSSYLPMLLVMIVNPVLFKLTSDHIRNTLRAMGLYTDYERRVVLGVQKKFFKIIVTFYICWIANLVNGFLLLSRDDVDDEILACIWSIMAVLNPLQGFFNAVLFNDVGGAYCFSKSSRSKYLRDFFQPISDESTETSPLLSFRRDEL